MSSLGIVRNHILIIEDDLSLRPFWSSIIRRCLGDHNLIDWAISSEEGKNFVVRRRQKDEGKGHQPYDLIISDIFLSGSETGIDFFTSEAIRKIPTGKILVSVADKKLISENFEKDLQDVQILSKPLHFGECKAAILKSLKH